MAERKPARKGSQQSKGFTAAEKAAMKERARVQSAEKFDSRYATFGFSDEANIDQGAMWPHNALARRLAQREGSAL